MKDSIRAAAEAIETAILLESFNGRDLPGADYFETVIRQYMKADFRRAVACRDQLVAACEAARYAIANLVVWSPQFERETLDLLHAALAAAKERP